MIQSLIPIALGGALGSVLRFLTVAAFGAPLATLAVNVVGSFLMGAGFVLLAGRGSIAGPLLMTGVLGGFTTFSAFSLDAAALWERGRPGLAALYVAGSVLLSIGGLFAGLALVRGLGRA